MLTGVVEGAQAVVTEEIIATAIGAIFWRVIKDDQPNGHDHLHRTANLHHPCIIVTNEDGTSW